VKLSELLYGVSVVSVSGSTAVEPLSITTDSRKVRQGDLFIAVRGTQVEGHRFIEQALQQGAIAIVSENVHEQRIPDKTFVQVSDAALAAALIAAQYYGSVSSKLQIVGVTGTNGKTTIATLLYKLFTELGYVCGLVSTVENRIGSRSVPSTHTTPDPLQLHHLLQQMEQAGCTHVFMEVSSHAIHQHRIAGIQFAGGIFSNITHDHLDYHKTFDEYIRVKKSFFDMLPASAFALSNADDKRGAVMLQNCNARRIFYALRTLADYKGRLLDNGLEGLQLNIDEIEVHFRLIGTFNAYNLLAVYGAACALGLDKIAVLTQLSQLQGAPGRFECITSPNDQVMAVVDYAHTPDALLNVLTTLRHLRKPDQKLTTVTGCGGDRDRTKRPLMAAAVAANSDRFIFTSDNPRSEDPSSIIKDMEEGLSAADFKKYIPIVDRDAAIKTAISLAAPHDIILVAGKGHETYQDVKGIKEHFDDRETVRKWFAALAK
jgi:UDP-N-acetylmuramoyl-L-alanyl-D-glutamate--2,6-diaminopimelate ligase